MSKKPVPQVVVLAMSDLTRLDRARAVRSHSLYASLQTLTPTTLLAGNRMSRRREILRYMVSGGLRRTRAVYVEASTSTATETDLLFLALAHGAGRPVIVFVPDAYQLFPDLYPRQGLKVKLLDWGWRRSIWAYQHLADLLLYPSWGLAACFGTHRSTDVLPPAGQPDKDYLPLCWETPTVVYVGPASYNNGSDLLLSAMEQVVQRHPAARCWFITNEAGFLAEHPARHAPWLTIKAGALDDLPEIMRSATVLVIPRRRNPYNDLAMPVKQFDYMSFGRPLVVTACRDTAALISHLQAGLVVEDSAAALAQGIVTLLEDRELATRLGQNGYQAVQAAHSWSHRAAYILNAIERLEQEQRDAHSAR